MVCITDNQKCCGCGACVDICPKEAIQLVEDGNGFQYPHVDASKCIHCGKCETVCPTREEQLSRKSVQSNWPPKFFAGQLQDVSELNEVSSGGAFWALAKTIILDDGVVYGARQEGVDTIRHVRATSLVEAASLRRSKYLPSSLSGIFQMVKNDLSEGRMVLFSGTGCQVAGLYSFLQHPHDNLTTCEVVCHGIPSHAVWRAYRQEHEKRIGKRMVGLTFRDKSAGWKNNQYKIDYEDGSIVKEPSVTHDFHAGYLAGLFNRPSCGRCTFARIPRTADITLADYWGYRGELTEDLLKHGVSLICVNTPNGAKLLKKAKRFMHLEPTEKKMVLASCRHLTHAPKESPNRSHFFDDFRKRGYYYAFEKNRRVRSHAFMSWMRKWGRRAKLIAEGWCNKGRAHDTDTISLVNDFCRELGFSSLTPRSFTGALRLLLSPRQKIMVISDNAFDCRLARRLGFKTSGLKKTVESANHYFAMKESLELLAAKGIPVFFVNRVGLEKKTEWNYAPSAVRRMKNCLDFPTMAEAPDLYESDLRELFGEKYTHEYIEALGRIPQIVRAGNSYRHLDCKSDFVNIVGGRRITINQPEKTTRTIHVYGRCGVFGYAVEDADTLPSRIQEELLHSGYSDIRVVNHGLWGADDILIDENFMRDAPGMDDGDIVLFYRKHFDERLTQQLVKVGLRYMDITHEWHQAPEAKWCFFDRPGHMNQIGYRIAAKIIVTHIIETEFRCLPAVGMPVGELKTPHLTTFLKSRSNDTFLQEIHNYVEGILAEHPRVVGETCGAIVMNCNPFTKGHRHLVEFASKKVGRLYIFVVEEDKSFFRFEDRFRMVKDGTKDIGNIVVIPSGNFIISSLTFPEYFMKDYVKEKNFDVSSDIRTFCEHIAPPLGISVRFAGQEPFDPVTARYNESMRQLLPEYGMVFVEIPRFEVDGKTIVSATRVRRLLMEKRFVELKTFVPASTMAILINRYAEIDPSLSDTAIIPDGNT